MALSLVVVVAAFAFGGPTNNLKIISCLDRRSCYIYIHSIVTMAAKSANTFRDTERQLMDIQDRFAELQKEVGIGGGDTSSSRAANAFSDTPSLTATVARCYRKLNAMVSKHKRLSQVWMQFESIEADLKPEALDELGLSREAKEEYLLADEERLRDIISALDDFKRQRDFVNTENLQGLPALGAQLKPLEAVHVSQTELARDHHERTAALLEAYNQVINMLSKKFVYWDAVLSAAEQSLAGAGK